MAKEDRLEDMRHLACILHGVYFGTFQALKEEKDFFDVYEIAIRGVNSTVESYFKHLQRKDVKSIISELEKSGLYQGLELKQKGEKYTFNIGKCLFAGGENGVHSSIKGIDIPCPIALAVCATISKENPDKRMYVYPSVYEPEGSVTQMDLITPEDYQKRLSALKKISRSK